MCMSLGVSRMYLVRLDYFTTLHLTLSDFVALCLDTVYFATAFWHQVTPGRTCRRVGIMARHW
eukprot:4473450-Pleurochrysis_carterae.AAC.1